MRPKPPPKVPTWQSEFARSSFAFHTVQLQVMDMQVQELAAAKKAGLAPFSLPPLCAVAVSGELNYQKTYNL